MEWLENLKQTDPELYDSIQKELERQRTGLEMIPSENFTSPAVMEAMGSILTNKYSEGYPGKRYYGGNQFIDVVERLAQERAKKLFNVPHANVQPYSGSPANFAVYVALCKAGDTIMGQELTHGGHLTHGWKTSATGMFFNSVQYHVKQDGYIDIDEVRKLAHENKPKIIWVGSTAYSREFPFEEFSKIADEVGAYLVADIAHISGLVIAGAHASPTPYVHIITTTTHKTLRGPRGAMIMVTQKGLDKDPELADKIDKAIFPGLQGGPHDHQTAGIAVALLEASKPSFKNYGHQIVKNSRALAEELKSNGLKLVTNGTDNHMILIDLTPFGKGKGVFVQDALDEAGITLNKNTIPNDPSSPFYPSGVRLGTPALTTRGMLEDEMKIIGKLISQVINEVKNYELPGDKDERIKYLKKFREEIKNNLVLKYVRKQVEELCGRFPLYPASSI
ncbi:MAG: serine hydroxymethyltransferase [Candidatus Aenigmarchaeota archaeon]|nr:serine hydroxymethyltransferase [Candidatus Aenigmarchaeota archaeon]